MNTSDVNFMLIFVQCPRDFKDPPAHPVPRVSEAPPDTPEPLEKWVHKESKD